ncbi:trimeric intracellular cation channel family protein [Glycomyces sp. TRM65418]|uniref:trimeric intracellular cation channel family protein n=1 Tax=Glycomyces sp. TRM65418 TaxID=2867006 RepID=UPI001D16CA8C|nr:trimeric intracellular cation channel family protein [Glycomyces sp. TRM65418]MCC3764897.1 trimeric intracellular cation channel family protein [Glycomyces sp. TRM65418]
MEPSSLDLDPGVLSLIAELVGTAVFAASGASAAVGKRLDLFGVVVIGVITALGGGAVRDLLIDAKPLVLTDWRYPLVALIAALFVFRFHPALSRMRPMMLVLDAAGLALFTAVGTMKGLDYGFAVYAACIVGVLSGIGGGILRDVLVQEIPAVLREDFYAMAAAFGAVIVGIGARWESQIGHWTLMGAAIATIFVVRLVAIRYRWEAPKPKF